MSAKNIQKKSKTNWKKLKSLKDKDIDFSDTSQLDKSFFKKAKLRLPERKATVTIRLDPDIIKWFKKKGKGYQTKINAVLRMFIEAQGH